MDAGRKVELILRVQSPMIAKARGKCLMCWGRANLKVKRRFKSCKDVILNDVLLFAKRDIFTIFFDHFSFFCNFEAKLIKGPYLRKCSIGVWL